MDIAGLPADAAAAGDESAGGANGPRRPFLSVWFQCCHAYGRMYRDDAGTMYAGRCPRCGARVQALIGPDGTSQRIFRAL